MVLYVAVNLLSLYILNNAINLFLKPKKNGKTVIRILMWVVYLVLGTFTYFSETNPVLNILIQVLLAMMIMILFEGVLKNKLAIALSWTMLIVISELMIGMAYSMILNVSLNQIVVNDVSKMIGSIMSTLIILIIVKAFQLYKNKKENFESIPVFDSLQVRISSLILPVLSSIV